MTDELKPSPEAVRVWSEAFDAYISSHHQTFEASNEAAALVIDRALRPATMPGNVVEAINPDWHYIDLFRLMRAADRSDNAKARAAAAYTAQEVQIAITAMQPAIQDAVDALDAVEAAQINPTYGWNITALNKARPLVASALATLRTVTEQGGG